jgi:hypothetical protein
VNLKDIPEQEGKSPKGKFGWEMNEISVMLGRDSVCATEAER